MRVLLAEWGEEGGQTLAVSVPLAQRSCLSGTLRKHCLFVVAAGNSRRQWGKLGRAGVGIRDRLYPQIHDSPGAQMCVPV